MIELTVRVLGFINQDEDVDAQAADKDHQDVHDRSPCHNDAKLPELILEQFVIQRRKAEVRAVLHLIEALGTPVDSCLRDRNKERHQDERKQTENHH